MDYEEKYQDYVKFLAGINKTLTKTKGVSRIKEGI